MNVAVLLVLLVVLAVYLLYPFFAASPPSAIRRRPVSGKQHQQDESLLSEVRFDYELGRIPEEYRNTVFQEAGEPTGLPLRVKTENAPESSAAGGVDDTIEHEVSMMRSKVSRVQANTDRRPKCPRCGAPRSDDDKFCGKCGVSFKAARKGK